MEMLKKTVLLLFFAFMVTFARSQSVSDTILIPLEEIDKPIIVDDNNGPKRGMNIFDIMPVAWYSAVNGEFVFACPHVTLEDVAYLIVSENGSVIAMGEVFLQRNLEEVVAAPLLSPGRYRIVLKTTDCNFYGEFYIE